MTDLATSDDVALALGLADSSELSTSQANRVAGLLSRVSRRFRREAGREFSAGTTEVRLLTVAGYVRLPDPVDSVGDVASATMLDCNGDALTLTYTLEGQSLRLEYGGSLLPSGVQVTVTYTHSDAVSTEVVADVAAIVARHLTVEPSEAKAKDMQAGPYRQTNADWVSEAALFTADDCATARSYSSRTPSIIIQRP